VRSGAEIATLKTPQKQERKAKKKHS